MGLPMSKQSFEQRYVREFKNPNPKLDPELQATNSLVKCFHKKCGRVKQICENISEKELRKNIRKYSMPGYCKHHILQLGAGIKNLHKNEKCKEIICVGSSIFFTYERELLFLKNKDIKICNVQLKMTNFNIDRATYTYFHRSGRDSISLYIYPEYIRSDFLFHVKIIENTYNYQYGRMIYSRDDYCMFKKTEI